MVMKDPRDGEDIVEEVEVEVEIHLVIRDDGDGGWRSGSMKMVEE